MSETSRENNIFKAIRSFRRSPPPRIELEYLIAPPHVRKGLVQPIIALGGG